MVQRCVHLVTPKLQAQSTVKLETTVRVLKTVEKLCVLCVFFVCSLCVLCVFSVGDLSVIWVDLSVLCGRLWESWCHQLERKGCARVDAQSAFFKSLFCIDFCFVPKQLHYGDMRIEFRVLMPRGPLSPEKKVALFEALEGLEWRSPNA